MNADRKRALITGGSRGIGRAIAVRLAKDGTKVAVNFKSEREAAEAQEVVEAIAGLGGEAMALAADITKGVQVEAMVKQVVDAWGGVDILVNNAGIIQDSLLMRMSEEAWDNVINTNLKGAYYCTKAVLRTMVRERWGRIISVASVAGIEGNAGQSNYAASKAGLIAFTKSVAKEVASRNITVNAVAPGFIDTQIVGAIATEYRDLILSRIPLGRYGETEDVANMVGYLASEEARYITGEVIRVDGGIEL
ncbi:MAG: 3-oxoacyl-[acyl-carrier-protein] reductase [Chloroflexi bacterium]|nr:3-oxoacyl-[acyl-carrier-protein] reductase [Chloroflexota bacterium]